MHNDSADDLDAKIEEHYASLGEDSAHQESLVERAEELKGLISSETQIPKLLAYATELAAIYRQLDAANIRYVE